MGKRQDGRIEPGQKLSGAISARAWNRAQDAADIVLAERTGFGAEPGAGLPDRLARNVILFVPAQVGRRVRFGMIVRLNGNTDNSPNNYGPLGAVAPTTTGQTIASPFLAVPFVDRRQTASRNFGVIVGGRVPENIGFSTGTISTVCTHGTCLAMVRKNPGGFLPKVRPAVIRYASDTSTNLNGIAEDSDCGAGELVYWTNIRPFSAEQQTAEGIQSPEQLDDTLNNVYYAVVRL
jgi:hypothetical protein